MNSLMKKGITLCHICKEKIPEEASEKTRRVLDHDHFIIEVGSECSVLLVGGSGADLYTVPESSLSIGSSKVAPRRFIGSHPVQR